MCQNDIPEYCPALTDGSIGDMLYFHAFKRPGLVLNIVHDIRARKAGMIILGGGVCKHQIANAMLIVPFPPSLTHIGATAHSFR